MSWRDALRRRSLRTIRPSSYDDTNNYLRFLSNVKRSEFDDPRSEEAFALYLGLQKDLKYLSPTILRPTIGKDIGKGTYYKVDNELEKDIFRSFKDKVKLYEVLKANEFDVTSIFSDNTPGLFTENGKEYVALVPKDNGIITGRPMSSNARMLGNFTVSKGKDKKGEYLSYADQYDLPPVTQGITQGKPYKIYGRIYYKDMEKADSE